MGQAKRRGTYEERKAESEQKAKLEKALDDARKKQIDEQNEVIRRDHAIRMAERQEARSRKPVSNSMRQQAMIASLMIGIGHLSNGE